VRLLQTCQFYHEMCLFPPPVVEKPRTTEGEGKEKDDVERSKETTPSRDHVAKETEKSSVTAARDQRLKSSRDRDKERTRQEIM